MCRSPGSSVRKRNFLIQINSQLLKMLRNLFSKFLRRHQDQPSCSLESAACILTKINRTGSSDRLKYNVTAGAHPQLVSHSISSAPEVYNTPQSCQTRSELWRGYLYSPTRVGSIFPELEWGVRTPYLPKRVESSHPANGRKIQSLSWVLLESQRPFPSRSKSAPRGVGGVGGGALK